MSNNQNEKPSASSTDEYNNEKLFTFDLDDINLYLSTDGASIGRPTSGHCYHHRANNR